MEDVKQVADHRIGHFSCNEVNKIVSFKVSQPSSRPLFRCLTAHTYVPSLTLIPQELFSFCVQCIFLISAEHIHT